MARGEDEVAFGSWERDEEAVSSLVCEVGQDRPTRKLQRGKFGGCAEWELLGRKIRGNKPEPCFVNLIITMDELTMSVFE